MYHRTFVLYLYASLFTASYLFTAQAPGCIPEVMRCCDTAGGNFLVIKAELLRTGESPYTVLQVSPPSPTSKRAVSAPLALQLYPLTADIMSSGSLVSNPLRHQHITACTLLASYNVCLVATTQSPSLLYALEYGAQYQFYNVIQKSIVDSEGVPVKEIKKIMRGDDGSFVLLVEDARAELAFVYVRLTRTFDQENKKMHSELVAPAENIVSLKHICCSTDSQAYQHVAAYCWNSALHTLYVILHDATAHDSAYRAVACVVSSAFAHMRCKLLLDDQQLWHHTEQLAALTLSTSLPYLLAVSRSCEGAYKFHTFALSNADYEQALQASEKKTLSPHHGMITPRTAEPRDLIQYNTTSGICKTLLRIFPTATSNVNDASVALVGQAPLYDVKDFFEQNNTLYVVAKRAADEYRAVWASDAITNHVNVVVGWTPWRQFAATEGDIVCAMSKTAPQEQLTMLVKEPGCAKLTVAQIQCAPPHNGRSAFETFIAEQFPAETAGVISCTATDKNAAQAALVFVGKQKVMIVPRHGRAFKTTAPQLWNLAEPLFQSEVPLIISPHCLQSLGILSTAHVASYENADGNSSQALFVAGKKGVGVFFENQYSVIPRVQGVRKIISYNGFAYMLTNDALYRLALSKSALTAAEKTCELFIKKQTEHASYVDCAISHNLLCLLTRHQLLCFSLNNRTLSQQLPFAHTRTLLTVGLALSSDGNDRATIPGAVSMLSILSYDTVIGMTYLDRFAIVPHEGTVATIIPAFRTVQSASTQYAQRLVGLHNFIMFHNNALFIAKRDPASKKTLCWMGPDLQVRPLPDCDIASDSFIHGFAVDPVDHVPYLIGTFGIRMLYNSIFNKDIV